MINLSFGNGIHGKPGKARKFESMADLAETIERRAVLKPFPQDVSDDEYTRVKETGAWFCPGTDDGERQKDNFPLVDYLRFDIDGVPEGTMSQVMDNLDEYGSPWLAYESTGHLLDVKDGKECFRVIMPVDQGINEGFLRVLTQWAADHILKAPSIDPVSWNINQFMYLPAKGVLCEFNDQGMVLDIDMLINEHDLQEDISVSERAAGPGEWGVFEELAAMLLEHGTDARETRQRNGALNIEMRGAGGPYTNGRNAKDAWQFTAPAGENTEIRFRTLHANTEGGLKLRDALAMLGDDVLACYDAARRSRSGVRKSGFMFAGEKPATVSPEQRAANLAAMGLAPTEGAAPKRQRARASASESATGAGKWNGKCGDYRDKRREQVASACKMDLWQVPPDVETKTNKDGLIIGYTPLNTSDNLEWLLELQGWTVARNTMTWEFEAFDRHGKALTRSASETDSLVQSECARRRLPDATYDRHITAIANRREVHPVREILHGRKWDGVKRVDRVLECLNADDPEYASAIMRALLVGGISAIDDGRVEMKFCPVLFSKANDWHKSQFVHRIFGMNERSYKGGIAIPDPTNKDSLANVLLCWGGEFGELGGMGKRDTEVLKAWIPQPSDEWRPPYAKRNERKARQTVYVGTVNREDFIKDPTIATRFPVIKLAGPVRIDDVNAILGWHYDGNTATLKDAEQLVQFWLEVRQLKADGASYILPKEVLAKVRDIGDTFTDKGSYYATLKDYLDVNTDENRDHAWYTATGVCQLLGANIDKCTPVGKALRQLAEEGYLTTRCRGGTQYWFPNSATARN